MLFNDLEVEVTGMNHDGLGQDCDGLDQCVL